jgi:phosphoglucomutase
MFSSHFLKFQQANGGFIMSASHNPGGPEYDWGIKVTFLINSHPFEGHGSIVY